MKRRFWVHNAQHYMFEWKILNIIFFCFYFVRSVKRKLYVCECFLNIVKGTRCMCLCWSWMISTSNKNGIAQRRMKIIAYFVRYARAYARLTSITGMWAMVLCVVFLSFSYRIYFIFLTCNTMGSSSIAVGESDQRNEQHEPKTYIDENNDMTRNA